MDSPGLFHIVQSVNIISVYYIVFIKLYIIFELSIRRYKNRHCIICLNTEDENNYFTTK